MWESLICALGGQILIAIVITLNGRAGAIYHIGFPIVNRAAFGVYGAWWPTFNRAVMAIVRAKHFFQDCGHTDRIVGLEWCQCRTRRTVRLCHAARNLPFHCPYQEYHGSGLCSDQRRHDRIWCLLAGHLLLLGHPGTEDEVTGVREVGRFRHLRSFYARLVYQQVWWTRPHCSTGLDRSWQ